MSGGDYIRYGHFPILKGIKGKIRRCDYIRHSHMHEILSMRLDTIYSQVHVTILYILTHSKYIVMDTNGTYPCASI